MTIAFQVFAAAHAAGSPASTGPVIFIDPVSESGKLFPSLADGNHGEFLVSILVLKKLDVSCTPLPQSSEASSNSTLSWVK